MLPLTMLLASIMPGMKDVQGISKVYQVKAEDGIITSGDWEYKIYNSYNDEIEITKYNGNDKELKVPETIDGHKVVSISQFAIDYAPLITITFPKTIESIGSSGQEFRKGKNLTSIKVEDSQYGDKYWTDEDGTLYSYYMKHTDQDQTEYTDYLTLIYCPKARNSKSYTIDDKVTAIDGDAFADCYNLEEVKLGNGVQKIEVGAFTNCKSLTFLDLPKSVKKIGYNAFVRCDKLASYNVAKDNENYCDVDGVLYTKDKTKLVSYPRGKEAEDQTYVVEPSCKELEQSAFSTDKLKKIILPNGLQKIGSFALDCRNLESIEIPDAVTTLGRYILGSNSKIKQLILPASITTIQYAGALNGMWELQYLYLSGPIPTDFESKERLSATLDDLRVLTVMIKEDYWDQYESYRNSFASDHRIQFEKWDGKTMKPLKKKSQETSQPTTANVGNTTTKTKTKITNPSAVKLVSVKNLKGKKAKVVWKKNLRSNGYQIQYATKKNFKSGLKNTTVKKNKTTSTTLKKLKKKKTYYVRVRTYKIVSGKNYYSKWSNVKKVKIKK